MSEQPNSERSDIEVIVSLIRGGAVIVALGIAVIMTTCGVRGPLFNFVWIMAIFITLGVILPAALSPKNK